MSQPTATPYAPPKLDKAPAYRWWILVVNMIAYGYFFMTVQATAAFSAAITQDWQLSTTTVSLLTTATMISFAAFAGLGGKLSTKLGAKKTVLIGLAVDTIASLLFIFAATSYPIALALRFCQGLAGGIMGGSIISSTSLWFPTKQRGLASGFLMGILGIGFSIATFASAGLLGAGMSWQTGLGLLCSVPGAIIAVLYAVTVREIADVYPGALSIAELLGDEAAQASTNGEGKPTCMAQAYRSKKFWACAFFGFASGWLTYGFSAFLGTLLTVDLSIDPTLVTGVIGSTFFITIIASPLGGIIADNVFHGQRYQVLMIGAAVTTISLALLPFLGTGTLVVTVLLVLAYGSVAFPCGTFWATPSEIVHESIAGECTGMIMVVANIGGVIVAPIISALIDVTGSAYIGLIICIAFAAISTIAARIIHQ